jgi:hypothetical protein
MSVTNERLGPYDLMLATDVLFPEKRTQALHRLQTMGFIDAQTLPVWEKELSRQEYHPRMSSYLIGALKIKTEIGRASCRERVS